MSRVYEAIQRADRERNALQEVDVQHRAEAPIAPRVVEVPEIKSDLDLEKIAHYPWKPIEASLPTLANVGASIEQFRSLRAHVDQLRIQASIKTILVSSGMAGEGKTFIAANLALSMARSALNSILLIDGDLRRGTLHKLLGAPNLPGLAEYLAGTADLMSIMQRCEVPENASGGAARGIAHVTFIPAGISTDNSSEVASSPRMRDLIAVLGPHFDWIVIDSPPVLAVTDAIELARAADAVLLVARGAETPLDVAQRAQAAFSNSRILGFVLNAVKKVPRHHSYSYYYGREAGQRQ
jgi:protein-tyrosine kinase